MRKHLIVGAGKWSHAHLRVLSEIGDCTVMITKPKFTIEESNQFKQCYPIVKHVLDQTNVDVYKKYTDLFYPEYVHIVTPTHTHLEILELLGTQFHGTSFNSQILVEKPAVKFFDFNDFIKCVKIKKIQHNICYNDWMSWAVPSDITPKKCIVFTYNVKNTVNDGEIIREVGSHFATLLLNFYDYKCDIKVVFKHLTTTSVNAELNVNGIQIILNINTGTGIKSYWQIKVDDYEKNSETSAGEELSSMFSNFINKNSPRTDWLCHSVLTEKLHQLLIEEDDTHWSTMELDI